MLNFVDAAARRRLVDDHLSMVRAIAAKVRQQVSLRLELDELVSYGTQGLLEAAERFDESTGARFSTFAYYRVRGAMFDGIRQMNQLPRHVYARARMAERAHETLENAAERERGAGPGAPAPTVEDDVRGLADAMAQVVTSYVTSLEALVDEGSDFAEDAELAEDVLVLRDTHGEVARIVEGLPEKERHFIRKHYFEGKNLMEAGQELGLSKSWASRLHARALALIREKLEKSAA
jgi:RNA polymerase sigma factor for flagellar operon FliA